jgi:ribose transport system substrate-binding protein
MAYRGIKTALAASKGEKVEATLTLEQISSPKRNINSPRSQELLSPKIK